MLKILKKQQIVIYLTLLLPFFLTASDSLPSFVETAKQAIPAVVSIKVKQTLNEQESTSQQFHDPFNFFFQDPFFRHFQQRQRTPSQERTSQGSGFLVSPTGYILTNAHVVKGASTIHVTLNNLKEYEGSVIGVDESTDVAVVKIEGENFPFLRLGDSDALQVGQWVIAIGNPLGLQASVTAGIVSAKGRSNLDIANIEDFIQTDAAINKGNSGGPLLNQSGDVVGMNTAIVTNMGNGGYMGIGFAIPSQIAAHVMEQLISSGTVSRGFIGITLQPLDQNLADALKIGTLEGVLVTDVTKDSPAEAAELARGDVIVKYNGKKVLSVTALRNAVALMAPGSKVEIEYIRDGKTKQATLSLAAFPNEIKEKEMKDLLGIRLNESREGLVISEVLPGSRGEKAGLKSGMRILAVNQIEVASIEAFTSIVEQAPKEQPLLLLVQSGNYIHFISLKK